LLALEQSIWALNSKNVLGDKLAIPENVEANHSMIMDDRRISAKMINRTGRYPEKDWAITAHAILIAIYCTVICQASFLLEESVVKFTHSLNSTAKVTELIYRLSNISFGNGKL
jgi:hypothetical protein